MKQRIRERLDDLGLSALQATKDAGLGDGAIQDLLRGDKPANPTVRKLIPLAKVLQCDINYLLGLQDYPERNVPILHQLRVVGSIQAGNWTDPRVVDDGENIPIVVTSPDECFALKVLDRSCDQIALPNENSYVVFKATDAPANGDAVVVRRKLDGLFELSLRGFERNNDGTFDLRSLSTDPRFEFLNAKKQSGDDVEILGVVISLYATLAGI